MRSPVGRAACRMVVASLEDLAVAGAQVVQADADGIPEERWDPDRIPAAGCQRRIPDLQAVLVTFLRTSARRGLAGPSTSLGAARRGSGQAPEDFSHERFHDGVVHVAAHALHGVVVARRMDAIGQQNHVEILERVNPERRAGEARMANRAR